MVYRSDVSLSKVSEIHSKPPVPFIKWAGGKQQLIPQLSQKFPENFKNYFEPFVGSAAVFFYLKKVRHDVCATLMDSNEELINCYQVVRDNLELLVPLLEVHKTNHSKEYYYQVRATKVERLSPVESAARFIYLNKTCYNGLYRVNSKKQFNVPMGSYINPRIFNLSILKAARDALQSVIFKPCDFNGVLEEAEKGDFIYFDPPYFPISKTSSFTSYSVSSSGKASFGANEQRKLAEVFTRLDARSCYVVLSNSNCDFIRNLYQGFTIHEVQARRAINCNGQGRGLISELVITNF
jgi:DNA adenine methylase